MFTTFEPRSIAPLSPRSMSTPEPTPTGARAAPPAPGGRGGGPPAAPADDRRARGRVPDLVGGVERPVVRIFQQANAAGEVLAAEVDHVPAAPDSRRELGMIGHHARV